MPWSHSRAVRALGALLGAGALGAACSSSPSATPPPASSSSTQARATTTSAPAVPTTTSAPAVPTTTSPPATTTTAVAVPTGLQSSASAAASALVSAWAANNRPRALSVATATAVNTLFADKYPGWLAIARGCSSSYQPIVCTYGPPGGGPSNAPIYQIYSLQVTGGWYVSSVQIES